MLRVYIYGTETVQLFTALTVRQRRCSEGPPCRGDAVKARHAAAVQGRCSEGQPCGGGVMCAQLRGTHHLGGLPIEYWYVGWITHEVHIYGVDYPRGAYLWVAYSRDEYLWGGLPTGCIHVGWITNEVLTCGVDYQECLQHVHKVWINGIRSHLQAHAHGIVNSFIYLIHRGSTNEAIRLFVFRTINQ